MIPTLIYIDLSRGIGTSVEAGSRKYARCTDIESTKSVARRTRGIKSDRQLGKEDYISILVDIDVFVYTTDSFLQLLISD